MRALGSAPQLKASQLPETTEVALVRATSSSSPSAFPFGSRSRAVLQSKLRAGLWWALLTLVLILGTVPLTLWLCQQPLHRLQQQQRLLETGGTASLQPDYYYQRLGMLLQQAEPLSAQEVGRTLAGEAHCCLRLAYVKCGGGIMLLPRDAPCCSACLVRMLGWQTVCGRGWGQTYFCSPQSMLSWH